MYSNMPCYDFGFHVTSDVYAGSIINVSLLSKHPQHTSCPNTQTTLSHAQINMSYTCRSQSNIQVSPDDSAPWVARLLALCLLG